MRKFLVNIPAAAVLVVLTATTLAACGGGGGDDAAGNRSSTTRERDAGSGTTSADRSSTTVTESSSPPQSSETIAAPELTASADAPPESPAPSPDVHFVCPEGGMAEAVALQEAVDQGHQPWRLSPEDVAIACTFGSGTAEPAGPNSYVVTNESTGESVRVDLAQPLGPDGIWVVTGRYPA